MQFKACLEGLGEMTLMVDIYIADGSLVLRFRMLSGAPEWMDS